MVPFTVEAIDAPIVSKMNNQPNQFDLPSKEYTGYDPKGTTTVTGSPIQRPQAPDVKQPDKTEGVAESPATDKTVTLSPQISALARKEQAQRQREQAFKQREKALEAKLADAEKFSQLKAKLASKDYSATDELGMSYDEYTQYRLDKLAGEKPEEQRFRKQQEEIESLKKAQEEQTVKEYKANQSLWKQEISKLVSENEAYSTIKELGAEHMVLQHVNDSFDEDGVELTAEQAAKEIEDALVERAEKFASVTKIKSKFSEPPKVLGAPKTSPKTITQDMTVTSQKPYTKPFHLMSESEQIAEAIRRVQAAKQQR